MPKNRRRKVNQNLATAGTSIPRTVEEPIPVNGNGDEIDLEGAPVLALPEETLTAVAQADAPTLRSLANLLTPELAVYVGIFIAALLLRLVRLDVRPLTPAEAQTSAAAWEFLNGQAVGVYASPLLFTLDWLSFLLFGAFDLTARFLPALLGAFLVFIPISTRSVLGKSGALTAALLLAFSPTVVFFGRALSGVDLAVGGALAALILLYGYRETRRAFTLYLAAALGALSLTADPAAFTILLAGGIYFATTFALSRRGKVSDRVDDAESVSALQMPLVRAALVFVAVFIVSATTFLLNRDGLGVAFNLFGDWANSYAAVGDFASPLNWLAVYEPLALIFGLAGLVLVLTARGAEGASIGLLRLLAVVAVVALLFYTFAGNKDPSVIVAVSVPMILLAGWFIGNLLERARDDIRVTGGWDSVKAGELPVFIMLLVLAALIYLQIATFLQQTKFSPALDELYKLFANGPEVSLAAAALTLAIIMLLLLGVFIGLAVLLVGVARTTTLIAFVILVLLGVGLVRATWLLNFSADEPLRELVAPVQTPLQVRDLVSDLEFLSQARNGDSHVITVAADPALGAVGRWYLRVFPHLEWTNRTDPRNIPQAIITSSSTPPPGNWMGQRYRVGVSWRPANLDGTALWKWYIFRELENSTSAEDTWQSTMLWLPTEK